MTQNDASENLFIVMCLSLDSNANETDDEGFSPRDTSAGTEKGACMFCSQRIKRPVAPLAAGTSSMIRDNLPLGAVNCPSEVASFLKRQRRELDVIQC